MVFKTFAQFVFKTYVFLWFPEDEWKILSAVGRIEAGQSITDVALFFGVPHSVISRLWKQFQTIQTVVWRPIADRPRVRTLRGRSIYFYFSQAESQSDKCILDNLPLNDIYILHIYHLMGDSIAKRWYIILILACEKRLME